MQLITPSGTISISIPLSQSIGIFTTDGTHAAALNQDGTVNSENNPAFAGSVVSLFGTGALWLPALQDGGVATSAIPLDQQLNKFLALDWTRSPINIMYAGTAPGLINGVFQANVQLPPNPVASGYAPAFSLQSTATGQVRSSNSVQIYIK
jgi:uncharacterized protein (TIGR03437 family)